MKFYASRKNQKGFTLVEITVAIAIVGILAAVVLISIQNVRKSARDKQRISDIAQLQLALRLYKDANGTYRVIGGGADINSDGIGDGIGWVSYTGLNYPKSITQVLYEQGYLPTANLKDPSLPISQRTPNGGVDEGYMLYLCGENYSLSATKEIPVASEITFAEASCNGVGANGIVNQYGKNYAVTN